MLRKAHIKNELLATWAMMQNLVKTVILPIKIVVENIKVLHAFKILQKYL